ncbi:MAG: hypothetical protein ACFFB8_09610 [Promethearchaeota archaeon]
MKLKIELGRQGNLILAILLIHFVFFGYICNIYLKEAGEKLLFLSRILFEPRGFFSAIILFIIVFFMVFREKFFEYGIRNSIWLTPIIIGQSWMWMWFIVGFDITLIGEFFINYEGYITIFSILGINLLAAILGAIARRKYEQYFEEIKKL